MVDSYKPGNVYQPCEGVYGLARPGVRFQKDPDVVDDLEARDSEIVKTTAWLEDHGVGVLTSLSNSRFHETTDPTIESHFHGKFVYIPHEDAFSSSISEVSSRALSASVEGESGLSGDEMSTSISGRSKDFKMGSGPTLDKLIEVARMAEIHFSNNETADKAIAVFCGIGIGRSIPSVTVIVAEKNKTTIDEAFYLVCRSILTSRITTTGDAGGKEVTMDDIYKELEANGGEKALIEYAKFKGEEIEKLDAGF